MSKRRPDWAVPCVVAVLLSYGLQTRLALSYQSPTWQASVDRFRTHTLITRPPGRRTTSAQWGRDVTGFSTTRLSAG
jgi:hypothetical protein